MIRFFTEDIDFNYRGRLLTRSWLKTVAFTESKSLGDINIIFCSDNYLLDINKQFLSHDYFTDIITFDYCENNKLSGDLFISIDTVRDNSSFYGSDFITELHRVIVHGLLHLIGFDDHSDSDCKLMRQKENQYLSVRPEKLYV